jgi:hypothetical protein
MASILACDTLAPDFMLRVTPDQNLTLSDPVSRAQRKVGMSVDGLMPCPIVRWPIPWSTRVQPVL